MLLQLSTTLSTSTPVQGPIRTYVDDAHSRYSQRLTLHPKPRLISCRRRPSSVAYSNHMTPQSHRVVSPMVGIISSTFLNPLSRGLDAIAAYYPMGPLPRPAIIYNLAYSLHSHPDNKLPRTVRLTLSCGIL